MSSIFMPRVIPMEMSGVMARAAPPRAKSHNRTCGAGILLRASREASQAPSDRQTSTTIRTVAKL